MSKDLQTNQPNIIATMPPFQFGAHLIPSTHVFHLSPSRLTYAFVNLKPLLPGHVLVSPVRVVPRYTSLSVAETIDLALTVRKVGRMVERVYRVEAMNIAIQDGEAAGQSVFHVHMHIIPRRMGDFDDRGGGDRIYEMLEEKGGEADVGAALRKREERQLKNSDGSQRPPVRRDAERKPRSAEVMDEEAEMLRRELEKDGDVEDEVNE